MNVEYDVRAILDQDGKVQLLLYTVGDFLYIQEFWTNYRAPFHMPLEGVPKLLEFIDSDHKNHSTKLRGRPFYFGKWRNRDNEKPTRLEISEDKQHISIEPEYIGDLVECIKILV